MKIILLQKIYKLGNIGNIISVKSGYARNFLLPKKKAILANKKNIEIFKKNYKKRKKINKTLKKNIHKTIQKINSLKKIKIKVKTNIKNKIFGSINAKNICTEIKKYGINISKKHIKIPNTTIKKLGSYKIYIKIHKNIKTFLIVQIITKNL